MQFSAANAGEFKLYVMNTTVYTLVKGRHHSTIQKDEQFSQPKIVNTHRSEKAITGMVNYSPIDGTTHIILQWGGRAAALF